MQYEKEIGEGSRFAFGKNWTKFLSDLTPERIDVAQQSLQTMLGFERLDGKRFLDIGSGSGLFSLAARRLGATVCSIDFDSECVACAQELRGRYFPDDSSWTISQGSVLDDNFMQELGQADVVYSWGVLHHTGNLAQALVNAADRVTDNGLFFISIYNDQGRNSKLWLAVKRAYNALPTNLRWLVLWPALVRIWGPTTLRDLIQGRPFHTWRNYANQSARGMSPWRDVVDWVGGLPFEIAKPEEIFEFGLAHGFRLLRLKTCGGGKGCNEFVFVKDQAAHSGN